MPTPRELLAEITSGPLAAELAGPFAKGDDAGVASVLARRDRTGYVLPRHVAAAILQDATGFGASLLWAWRHGTLADGSDLPAAGRILVAKIGFALDNPTYAFRLPPAELAKGCSALGAPDSFSSAITAGETKVSRLEELGWGVSDADVARARKAGG